VIKNLNFNNIGNRTNKFCANSFEDTETKTKMKLITQSQTSRKYSAASLKKSISCNQLSTNSDSSAQSMKKSVSFNQLIDLIEYSTPSMRKSVSFNQLIELIEYDGEEDNFF